MDYSVLVQVFECTNDLSCVALDFKLVETLASFQKFVHALVRAQLQQDVHVLAIFKEVLEVAHVGMLDATVNFDFTHELLLRSTLRQARLLDDFRSMNEARVSIYELVTLGEASLAKELALNIAPYSNLPTAILFEFLFNDRLRRRARLARLSR